MTEKAEKNRFVHSLQRYLLIWAFLSAIVIIVALTTTHNIFYFLLIGSALSICGCLLTFAAGNFATAEHRNKYLLIYCLVACSFFVAVKTFISAVTILEHSVAWQGDNDTWCYFMAILGHFSMIGCLGYSLVLILDITICAASPTPLKFICYHVTIWGIATISCLPALIDGAIGINPHGVCLFTNLYSVIPGIIIAFFHAYCVAYGLYVACKFFCFRGYVYISKFRILTDVTAVRCLLIFVSISCAFVWMAAYYANYRITHTAPRWLHAIQLFWLGGVGFSNSLVWYPFIKKSMLQVRIVMQQRKQQELPGIDVPVYIRTHHVDTMTSLSMPQWEETKEGGREDRWGIPLRQKPVAVNEYETFEESFI